MNSAGSIATPDISTVESLVAEGKRVGKTPWYIDAVTEMHVFDLLNNRRIPGYPQYPMETMDETRHRRIEEEADAGS